MLFRGLLKSTGRFLPLLLCCILLEEVCVNYIFYNFSSHNSALREFVLYSLFLGVTIIFSPIQSGYSDFYCRKKSLIVALSFSLLSVVLIFFSMRNGSMSIPFLSIVIIAKAGLGNILPLTWAAIADSKPTNFRFSLGLSTGAMGSGYLVLILIRNMFSENQAIIVISGLALILLYICVKKFEDIRDKKNIKDHFRIVSDNENTGIEENLPFKTDESQVFKIRFIDRLKVDIKLIINNFLKDKRTRKALAVFMLWEISFYSALIADIDMKLVEFKGLSLSMLMGYLLGVVILKFLSRLEDIQVIKLGYYLSILSLLPIFILFPVCGAKITIVFFYFFYALAAAFLAPSLFSILSKERKPHEQGKIYGLIDSSDTFAFLLASISVMIYHFLQLNPIFLSAFSLLVFIISVLPYVQFRKLQPKSY